MVEGTQEAVGRRGAPRLHPAPVTENDTGDTNLAGEFLHNSSTEGKLYRLTPLPKLVAVDPTKEAPFRTLISYNRFSEVCKESRKIYVENWRKERRNMSMTDLISKLCFKYMGRRITWEEAEAMFQAHTKWQEAYYKETNISEIPWEAMIQKVLELFSVGIKPKTD